MDDAARGAAALSTDPLLAISCYTKALIEHPTSPDYYIQRSIAFTRLKTPYSPRYDLALEDAELAVLLAQKRAKREKIQAAQQRRVVALFGLHRYGDAAMVLETMVKWRAKDNKKDQMEGDMWKTKIEQRIKALDSDDESLNVTCKEYPPMDIPSEAELKEALQAELGKDGLYKFTTDQEGEVDSSTESRRNSEVPEVPDSHMGNVTQITSDGADHESDSIPPTDIKVERSASISHTPLSPSIPADNHSGRRGSAAATARSPIPSKIRHEWYQNPQAVYLTIYAKGVPKDKTNIEITEDSVRTSCLF